MTARRWGLVSIVLMACSSGPGAGEAASPAPAGLVRMTLDDVKIDAQTHTPLVILTAASKDRALVVLIGHAEALAIAQHLGKLPAPPRPMTHDLLKLLLDGLGATLERIVITKIEDNTFFAELVVRQGKATRRIDCRPSDAMALALRTKAPIFCAKSVLDQAGVDPGELPKGPEPKPDRPLDPDRTL